MELLRLIEYWVAIEQRAIESTANTGSLLNNARSNLLPLICYDNSQLTIWRQEAHTRIHLLQLID